MKRLVFLILLIASTAFSAEKVTIEADTVDTPEKSIYHAKGNVKIFQGEKTLLADEIFYNKENNAIHAIGNVKLTEDGSILECSEMNYDTEKESGVFIDTKAFMPPYHWITASKIDKQSKYSYKMDDATFSTCEGAKPDWSFKASEANISVGGYLSSWHTTARIKNVPVFYTPYFIYPIKTERETGFLVPNAGYNSNLGAYFQPKFYWNIGVDQDATFASLIAANAPSLNTLEHRIAISKRSNIQTYIEYTADEKRYPNNKDGVYTIEEERGRFFINNKTTLTLSDSILFRAQVDAVSDYEYIDDFGNYKLLDDYENDTDTYKTNLTLTKTSKYADFAFKYLDTMEYNVGTYYSKEHTYSAPRISIEKNISALPINFKYFVGYDDVRYTNYYYRYANNSKKIIDSNYQREHVSLKLYKPVDLYIGTFTPSLEIYHTKWHNFSNITSMPVEDTVSNFAKLSVNNNSISRNTYMQYHTFKLNEIYKDYTNFKHSIYNKITYKQVPRVNQTGLFDYIYQDNIDWTKEYVYTLSNYFKAKKWSIKINNSQEYSLLRRTKKFENLISDVSVSTKPVFFFIKHEYNRYDKDVDYLHTRTSLNLSSIILSASYTFDIDDYGTVDNNTSSDMSITYRGEKYDLNYTREISGMNERLKWANFIDKKDTLTVTYKKDCWAFGISYIRDTQTTSVDINEKDETEQTIMFTLTLRGVGEYSTGLLIDKTEEDY
ncbi:MAG: hypothetical protein C0603_11990 [Denitrovibrio sp.]|nr:MAG: hypothetical protein C0603_11990 [Denitrovibrio sp.]